MIAFGICLLLLLIFTSKNKYKTYINPITLFIGIQLFSIILMFATSIVEHSLSTRVCILILIMMITYLLGTVVERKKIVIVTSMKTEKGVKSDYKRLRKLIIIYSIVFDFFAMYYLFHLSSSYGLKRMLSDLSGLNVAIQTGDFESGIYTYFTPIGVSLSMMILFYLRNYNTKSHFSFFYMIQYLLCFVPCISPRRDYFFYMLIVTVLYAVTQTSEGEVMRKSTKKKFKSFFLIVGVVLFGICIMSYTQQLMNKDTAIEFMIFGVRVPKFLKDPVVYIAGNYPYLEELNKMGELQFSFPGISTFRLIYRYLSPIFGANVDTTTIFALKFYNIGFQTPLLFNTAPILYYIIKEAGIFFGMIFFVIGMLSEKAYHAVNQKNSIGKIMIGIFQYSIIFLSFRGYNLIYQSYLLSLIYIYIAYKYIDVNNVEEEYE